MNPLLQTLKNLGTLRLAAMAGVAVAVVAFFVYLTANLSSGDMALLYSDLDLTDSGQIAAQLEQQDIPYEVRNGGATILVPAAQVDRLRLTMAAEGLPRGGSLGYELFDQSDGFGSSSFVQNINRLRALEGELARSISTLDDIRQARVHLVLPERELFSRDHQEASASVILSMQYGSLSSEQIAAIQHVVSGAVPQLDPSQVSIIDDRGNVLASATVGEDGEMRLQNSEDMRLAEERRLTNKIMELLSSVVGYGKVRAEVSLEMDFDRVTITSETYDPESQVARSMVFTQDESETTDGMGDPVTVGTTLPEQETLESGLGVPGSSSRQSSSQETVNYEIDRQVETSVRETGVIRRVAVAVVIDGQYQPDAATGETVYVSRTEEELAVFEDLVQAAVGFDANRGDTVTVTNLRFITEAPLLEGEDPSTILGLPREDIFRIAEMLVLGVVAVLVLLLVVRPLLSRVLETGRQQAPDEFDGLLTDQSGLTPALAGPVGASGASGAAGLAPMGDMPVPAAPVLAEPDEDLDQLIDINRVEGRVRASSLKKVGEIVDKHPEEAVSIIRSWMYQES